MAVYVVTWNINKERANYSQARTNFLAVLEKYDFVADSGLETVRWISTAQSAQQVNDALQAKLDSNDRLFVTRLNKGEHQGWLQQTTWSWINARL